jgi:hypothetical protein
LFKACFASKYYFLKKNNIKVINSIKEKNRKIACNIIYMIGAWQRAHRVGFKWNVHALLIYKSVIVCMLIMKEFVILFIYFSIILYIKF